MPRIETQSQFRKWSKPDFCYLCGDLLENGAPLNDDHCPPQAMFAVSDRISYPIKMSVHVKCNHRWHAEDEKLAIFFDILHGGAKASVPALHRKLTFLDVETEQGTSKA